MPPKTRTTAAPATLAEQVEQLASYQFRPEEVALIVGLPAVALTGADPALTTAYQRGRLTAEAEVRKSILQMARQGSSPAQKQLLDIIARNDARETAAEAEARRILAQLADAELYQCDHLPGGLPRPSDWTAAACPCAHCSAIRWIDRYAG